MRIHIHHHIHLPNETKLQQTLEKILELLGGDKVEELTQRLDKTNDNLQTAVDKNSQQS